MTSLAIIGTAGRNEDASRLASNPKHYYIRMLDCARRVAHIVGADTLVSGGAAWSDMCAILLFLERPDNFNIDLELPAPLECVDGLARYYDNGELNWRTNPGGTANHYLIQYAKQCADFTSEDFPWAQFAQVSNRPGVKIRVTNGFKERNLEVAKSDHCLAMTFGNKHQLKDGGTSHTMSAFLARERHGDSYHLDLNTLSLYKGATI